MAVRRSQICRDECMAVGFIRLANTPSLQMHFRPRSRNVIITTEDWESISGVWPALLAECQLLHCSHIFFSACALQTATYCHVCGRYFVFLAAYSVIYSPSVQFYPEMQPVWYGIVEFNVPLDTAYRSFRRRGLWAVMYISHSVMEGQRHNNPLNPRCFCLQRPKRDGISS